MERESQNDNIIPLPQCQVYLKSIPGKGRGVYAGENISKGVLIHISPVLLFPQNEMNNEENNQEQKTSISSEQDILSHYTYTWNASTQALALGLGSMFNHSKYNNVGYLIDKNREIISYHTIREVSQDEELCINYGNKLWFVDVDDTEKSKNDHDDSDDENCEKFLLKINVDEL